MEMNFCRRCGNKLQQTAAHEYRCDQGHTVYANPSPTVGVFLVNQHDQVLLAVRGVEPHKGMLDTFGGFIEIGESIEQALVRELREELGLESSDYTTPVYVTSAVGNYEQQSETATVLGSFFWVRLLTNRGLTAADDVAGIRTLGLNEIDYSELHNDDIRAAVRRFQEFAASGLLDAA